MAKTNTEMLCPSCAGGGCRACRLKGRVTKPSIIERARMGGNASYLNSFRPDRMSMSERGKKGPKFRLPRIQDLEGRA